MTPVVVDKNESSAVIKISAPFNSSQADAFESEISELTEAGVKNIIADMTDSQYISSGGIGSIIYAHKKLAATGGEFSLFGLNDECTTLLKILGIYRSLKIAGDVRLQPARQQTEAVKFERKAECDGGEIIPLFDHPLVIECASCSAFTRVHRAGDYICPACHTEFSVEQDGTVIF